MSCVFEVRKKCIEMWKYGRSIWKCGKKEHGCGLDKMITDKIGWKVEKR